MDDGGHAAGDRVLEATAELLREHSRPGDLVARLGGDEFIVVLADATPAAAADWAERVRAQLRSLHVEGVDHPLTASFGVATHDGVETADELIARADDALYRAKRAGRDQVALTPTLKLGAIG